MWILGTLIVLFGIGIFLAKNNSTFSGLGTLGEGLIMISSLLLLACAISIPINRIVVHTEIQAIQEIRTLANNPRNSLESAAFQTRVSDANEFIAKAKYIAEETPFGLWWPEEVMNLEPIN